MKRLTGLGLMALILWSSPLPGAAQLQNDPTSRGVAAFKNDNFNSAFRYLVKPARSEDPTAQFFLGRMYIEGGGVIQKEKRKGYSYVRKAAAAGHKAALWYLAKNHLKGKHIDKNISAAIKFAKILCEKNDIKACTFEANLLQQQPNIKNKAEACRRFTKLYRSDGEITAAMPLAKCILAKRITPNEPSELEKLLKVALQNGDPGAQSMLLDLYFASDDTRKIVIGAKLAYQLQSKGQLDQRTRSAATKYLKFNFKDAHCVALKNFNGLQLIERVCTKAHSNGGTKSSLVLANLYSLSYTGDLRDLKAAKKYALIAVENNIVGATVMLMKILETGKPIDGQTLSFAELSNIKTETICKIINTISYKKFDARGINPGKYNNIVASCRDNLKPEIILKLAEVYRDKFGDEDKYLGLLRLSCRKLEPKACFHLGEAHKVTSSNYEANSLALEAYAKAAGLGHAEGAYQCYLLANQKPDNDDPYNDAPTVANEDIANDCLKRGMLLWHPQATLAWAEKELGWFVDDPIKRHVCKRLKELRSRQNLETSIIKRVQALIKRECS